MFRSNVCTEKKTSKNSKVLRNCGLIGKIKRMGFVT